VQLHISSQRASGVGVFLFIGAGLTAIQAEEYAIAIVFWGISAVVLLSKAINWKAFDDDPLKTKLVRIGGACASVMVLLILVTWTQLKRGDKKWTAFNFPGQIFVAPRDIKQPQFEPR
jgi:hypothetical protein